MCFFNYLIYRDPSEKGNNGSGKSGGKGMNESSNSGNDTGDDSSNEATSVRTNNGSDHIMHNIGNHQSAVHHQLNTVNVPNQSAAAAATQSAMFHHGFRLNHHHLTTATHTHHQHHHLADVAPSALVMHAGGHSPETMLQLSAVAAAAGIDYSSSLGGTSHSTL